MDEEKLDNLADDFATKYIIEYTNWQIDGTNHRKLVRLFKEFGIETLKLWLEGETKKLNEHSK